MNNVQLNCLKKNFKIYIKIYNAELNCLKKNFKIYIKIYKV